MLKPLFISILIIFNLLAFSQTESDNTTPLDTILKQKLETIRLKDQTLRLLIPDIIKKFGKKSKEEEYINTLIQSHDSILSHEITQIIDKHGWLGINRIGYFANQAIWLVIQHSNLITQEKYLPYLKASVENGESEGWYLAFLEDRILMRNGEEQLYGTQAKYNKKTGSTHICPIKDVINVNERRKILGLEPIEEYAKKNGYIFNQ